MKENKVNKIINKSFRKKKRWIERNVLTLEAWIASTLRVILICITIILFGDVLIQVLNRYVFIPFSTRWTLEVARYLFVWASLLAAPLNMVENRQTRIGFLVDRLPFKYKKIIEIFSNLVVITTSVVVIQSIIRIFPIAYLQLAPATKLRMSYVYIAGFIGGMLFILFSVGRIIRFLIYNKIEDVMSQDK